MLKLSKDKHYLLACSYGPDSMALFQMLLNEDIKFDVAHVEYNIREDSKKETEELKKFCLDRNIKLFTYVAEEKIERNVEERCREIRYEYFHDLFLKHDYAALLVAHHQDDLIETYLLQKQRNILPHYYGLKEETVLFDIPVIRPLLSYKKADLLEFCKENQVPFALDYTNFLDIYLRNKIRHHIVEKMDEQKRNEVIEIIKEKDHTFRIKGESIERTYSLINISTDEGLMRLINYLRKIGIEEALKEKGAQSGDSVFLCDFEFEYLD